MAFPEFSGSGGGIKVKEKSRKISKEGKTVIDIFYSIKSKVKGGN